MDLPPPQHENSPQSKLRIGLIGSGKMGRQHLRVIASLSNAQIVGIADPAADDEELRKLIPSQAEIFADARSLLDATRPDVIHIVTPPKTHVSLATLALESGAHVYIEKPFAPSVDEARAVLELAQARNLHAIAGHQCLFEKPAMRAGEMLPEIGEVVHVESFSSFRTVRRTITPIDQCKDILPHAVYPLTEQLRIATGIVDEKIEVTGIDANASGDVYALVRLGGCTGVLEVTLRGRPIEQYQHIVGTNGSLRADYVIDSVIRLVGPGTGIGVLFTPYRRAFRTIGHATIGFARLALGRRPSYPGLHLLIRKFYEGIQAGSPSPIRPQSILDTVDICERIGNRLDEAEEQSEETARRKLAVAEAALPAVNPDAGVVLVTGGTGMLGRPVTMELRHSGFSVRALARRLPRASQRVPGVEYMAADLALELSPDVLRGVSLIVHCAAATAGGKREHERDSIAATRHLIETAARAGIGKLVHISSLAVLRPVRGSQLDEATPVDVDNLGRGPYVWGKAESEMLARRLGPELGVSVKVVRPGPLVDFLDFHAPGRLGRELGPIYVAVGPRKSVINLCDVWTGARVIRSYAHNFSDAPDILNLIEGVPPKRRELVARLRQKRPDLRVIWMPGWLLWLLNGPLKLAQRVLLKVERPIDVYRAFASERYSTEMAVRVAEHAGPGAARDPAPDRVTA